MSLNPQGVNLQKTLCSLIILSIERKQRLVNRSAVYGRNQVKYNPAFLKECLLDREHNNILEIMKSPEFDVDYFGLTIKLFRWYDTETKLILLEFYRQLIEEGSSFQGNNIEDYFRQPVVQTPVSA